MWPGCTDAKTSECSINCTCVDTLVADEVLLPPMGKSSHKVDYGSMPDSSFSMDCRHACGFHKTNDGYKYDLQCERPKGEEDEPRCYF